MEYYEKIFSHAQNRTQGDEKQLSKVNVVVGCGGMPVIAETVRSSDLTHLIDLIKSFFFIFLKSFKSDLVNNV